MCLNKLFCFLFINIVAVKTDLTLVFKSKSNKTHYEGYGLVTDEHINDAVSCSTEDGPIQLSQVNDNPFQCIKYKKSEANKWEWKNSFTTYVDSILDERWENFTIHKNKEKIHLDNTKTLLNVPLSIWSNNSVTILLFKDDKQTAKIILDEHNIQIDDDTDNKNPNITFMFGMWNHITIRIKTQEVIVRSKDKKHNIKKKITLPNYVQIESHSEVFWKVHAEELSISKVQTNQQYHEIEKKYSYLKLFSLGPSNSRLNISFFDAAGNMDIPLFTEFIPFPQLKWQTKFIFLKEKAYTIYLKATNYNITLSNIWNCESNDSRVFKFTVPKDKIKSLRCELLGNQSYSIKDQTIFDSCHSSKYFENGCKTKTEYTHIFGDYPKICNTQGCFCRIGYEGGVCERVCNNTWGLNCKEKCGKCLSQCNNINGTCDPCQTGYYGDKCKDRFLLNTTVYSKNTTHVWFRWKISTTNFVSFQINQEHKVENIQPKKCELWKDYLNYYCTVVYNSSSNNKHRFTLSGEYQNKMYILNKFEISTDSEKSSCPQNLTARTNEANNEITLKWFHPNITNTPLKKFLIDAYVLESGQIITKNKSRYVLPIVNNETQIYQFQITLEYATSYNISVFGGNGKRGEESHIIVNIPPSKPKILNKTVNCDEVNCSLKIIFNDTISNSSIYLFSSNYSKHDNLNNTMENEILKIVKQNNSKVSNIQIEETKKINQTKEIIFIVSTKNFTDNNTYFHFIIVNTFRNLTNSAYDTIGKTYTEINMSQSLICIYLTLIIFIIIVLIIGSLYYKKRYLFDRIFQRKHIEPSVVYEKEQNDALITLVCENVSNQEHVQVKNLENYILKITKGGPDSNLLNKEFQAIPKKYDDLPCHLGSTDTNKKKNRYNNLPAYDHSRVVLKTVNKNGSDYINANYVNGYQTKNTFIATQGPKANTVNDFWEMVWQENVKYIVMVANEIEDGKKKCLKYWIDTISTQAFGNYKVENIQTEKFVHYTYRRMSVTYNKDTRIVKQYQFTSWPDHGVPLYCNTFIPFLAKVLEIPDFPILVHCSAGVGRTGTLIFCYIALKMAAAENKIDFISILKNLRRQRTNLVDNYDQYLFAHMVIYERLLGMDYSISVNNNFEQNLKKISSKDLFQYLNKSKWQIDIMHNSSVQTISDKNKKKNRIQNMKPGYSMIYLTAYPFNDPDSTYINAEFVDCFLNPRRYITTQQPLPNTIGDFWRLIHDHAIETIINLNEIDITDPESCIFWPEANQKLTPTDYLEISVSDVSEVFGKKIKVQNIQENTFHEVTLIQLPGWFSKSPVPTNMEILKIWEQNLNKTTTNPTVVTCYDGITGCGLFVAMSFMLEQIKLEQICDVPLAVKAVRHGHIDFVTKQEQIDFLFKVALKYVKEFEIYANFDN